ncbi:putative aminotransferase [Hoyosella rhizosphaerae]|uniref:Aminotransferase n=1 Tax=Hoyosella rhizosphaerae TaxID=1755582 RepID=A0A916UI80_9ACTN|nr:putative aminotransferase [Hoyosella rhizosphaerae]
MSRLEPFRTTVFAEMTELAVRHEAINLGQGFPDEDGPASMLEAACSAILSGANQYTPGAGAWDLREAVADDRYSRYGIKYDPQHEVLITVGATEGITAAILALTERGDEVVLIEPFFDSYPAAVALAGATLRTATMETDGDCFVLDIDSVRAAITPATKVLVVNSPHNPTGSVMTEAEAAAIADLAVSHDLIVVVDEVYEHLVFDGRRHISLATLPGMRERTISVSSAGKTFNVTGWKIGWVCGPAHLVSAVRAAKQFMSFVSGAPLQPAIAVALRNELPWVRAMRDDLNIKRDILRTALSNAGFKVHASQGTYFVIADATPLSLGDATKLCRRMPEEIGVAAVPVSAFVTTNHHDRWRNFVRFAFSKRHDVLADASQRLVGLHR